MAQEQGGRDQEQGAGARLARLLRRWWEEAGSASGGTRPTQQALAARLGVDQTTLSRYLNPKHTSTAPLRVVEALHAQLRAPAAELDRARALCRAALRENSGRRTVGGGGEPTAATDVTDGSGEPAGRREPAGSRATAAPAGPAAPHGPAGGHGSGAGRPRFRWHLHVLVWAAVVVAFAAGVLVHERFAVQDRKAATADGAAGGEGAVAASEVPHQWPLLVMGEQDQFTRARALQNLLNAHGYEVGADGFFGEDTRDAVMAFQRKRGLAPDGKVGKHTWPELVKEVKPGSGTFEVRAAQELLNNVGQGGTVVSGEFTAVTAEDLRFFQSTRDLPVTGRVDVDTWLALLVAQLPPAGAPAYQRPESPPPSGSAPASA
ncbi:peptidoglycan-binding protein [Streptomyces hirsutus]|uniref:Peptidoglycan-binding protein n=1 Tax=Streptomyces hirsutus TaxID=35620 RepID=A0ABZ1GMJ1_9ACTN|nr:peptidoglycan-binding protein [Streptomyces hirsutus]WSD06866.1 peptidoglycan-binding protein [Streptomyces hirsutus]WTD19722.1 peptidoglycan-binding protein [Streptomyces hirsutus]WTD75372.1 peptidoglycan-binding protein [Streptomyces sp. NBC_01635]